MVSFIPLTVSSDTSPAEVYLFDRQTGQARFSACSRELDQAGRDVADAAVDVKARDGVMLHGYVTLPRGSTGKNLPLIINPHGGPHGVRDDWGFNPEVQLFANRGYAVLQINCSSTAATAMPSKGSAIAIGAPPCRTT